MRHSCAALLVYRTQYRLIQLLSYTIPLVALVTLAYSGVRFLQSLDGTYTNSISDSFLQYFAMGTFGEVLTRDGLVVRLDTVGQGAYGMYLVLVMTFSLTLAMFRGWGAQMPFWYPWGQAFVVCPLATIGILYTGSRMSFMLMSGVFLMLGGFFLTASPEALSNSRKAAFLAFIVLLVLVCIGVWQYAPRPSSSLERVADTVLSRFHFEASAAGELAPSGDENDRRKAIVRNLDTRVWLWGQTFRYLRDHPRALMIGIGQDRKRFLEEVIGLPYEGNLIHFHTAHNLFLDILAKGGFGALAPLLILCVWVSRKAYLSIHAAHGDEMSRALNGAGCLLFLFWPPFVLANLFGEEMFTDNLQLHWTMFLGVLCGVWGRRTNQSLLLSREQKLTEGTSGAADFSWSSFRQTRRNGQRHRRS